MRKALGKGIRAIIPEETQAAMAAEARPIRIDEIRPNPFQPRTKAEENLEELVASIKAHGVLQPIMVRRRRDGYEVVMGERRLRASKLAGLEQVPAVIRTVDELEMLEFALIENLQRQNLNPIDEAMGYKRLNDEFNQTHEVIAERVGKDTALNRIVALVAQAAASRSPLQRLADRASAVFVPAVVAASLAAFLAWASGCSARYTETRA